MTITNDERREITARLRESQFNGGYYIHKDDKAFDYFMELVDATNCHEDMELHDHLADLIEPEPERTCQNLGREEGTIFELYDFGCSECGFGCDVCEPNYCPYCGARVVEE